jgi:hypothetical protein
MELKVMASQSWGVYQLKANPSKHLAPLSPNILNPTIGKETIHSIVGQNKKTQFFFFVILISQYVYS